MVALNEKEKALVEQFQALAPQRRRYVLLEMTRAGVDAWQQLHGVLERQLREFARSKGLDWDQLDEEARQDVIEELADGDSK